MFFIRIVICFICLGVSVQAADFEDLFDANRLIKHLKAKDDQKTQIATRVAQLKEIVSGYQTTRAKTLCEAILWQGHVPRVKTLRNLRKTTLDSVDATIDRLKQTAGLDEGQIKRLDKILKGNDSVLDYPIANHPYYHVKNSPLFPEFTKEKQAYRIILPGTADPNNTWTYPQLLQTWTVRGFIPTVRPIDDIQQAPSIAEQPDLQTRVLPTPTQTRIVRSPLLIAATLLIPDLGRAEFDLLKTHYPPDSIQVTTWEAYKKQNRIDDAIQVRLKLNSPYNETYLDLNRWTIYLEDSEGTGYEPIQIEPRAFYPLEAVRVSVPGREIEVTDVFGNYFSPIPGEKERFYLEAPAQITYVGNEKLIQLYFPGHDFQKKPVVDENTKFLKLIVQSQETDFGRSELIWDLKKPKSKLRPPKG